MSEPQKLARIGQDKTETCERPPQASLRWLATPSTVDKSRTWSLERGPPLSVVLPLLRPEANSGERSQAVF